MVRAPDAKVVTPEVTAPLPTDPEAGTLPKATDPFTRIRTGGRKYPGVSDSLLDVFPALASAKSQLSRNGSQRFGRRNQWIPPAVCVAPTAHAAKEFMHGNLGIPTASMVVPPPLSKAMRTG